MKGACGRAYGRGVGEAGGRGGGTKLNIDTAREAQSRPEGAVNRFKKESSVALKK